jgi:hypothetical protein
MLGADTGYVAKLEVVATPTLKLRPISVNNSVLIFLSWAETGQSLRSPSATIFRS